MRVVITFNQQNLFDSGPAVLRPSPRKLRQQTHVSATGQSVTVQSLGHEPQLYEQTGTLLSDTPAGLRQTMTAIESRMDGLAYPLVDDVQRLSIDAVLIHIEIQPITAVGSRFKADYTLRYLKPQNVES